MDYYENGGYASPSDYDQEQELREYDAKRLNEELQIMRSQYTMFYEDCRKNKRKKRKLKQKQRIKGSQDDDDEKMLDVIHDDEDSESGSYPETENETGTDVDYTTESDVYKNKEYRNGQRNDYDHILMYSNKKRIKKNKKRAKYLCFGIVILFLMLLSMTIKQKVLS